MACAGAICNITNFLLNQLMNRRSVAAGQSILDLRMDPALIVLIVAVSHGQRASRRDTGHRFVFDHQQTRSNGRCGRFSLYFNCYDYVHTTF